MTVPLVQGTLRYAWKTGQIGGADNKASDQSAKNSAEGSTFAAAVLPLVHACDATAAKTVSDHMKFGAAVYDKTTGNFASGTKPDTAAVKAALESTYDCLGITCAHVGGLLSSDGVTPEAGMGACADAPAEKITGDEKHKVKIEVKAEGVVSDYDTPAKRAPLESKMATVAGVDVNAVTLTVKEATSRRRQLQAGSVILSFVIVTDDAAAATAVKNKVTTELADTTKASAALGVTVTEVPTVTVGSDTAAEKKDDDGLSGGAIAGIIIGAVVGLLCIGGIIFFAMKSGKNVDPK